MDLSIYLRYYSAASIYFSFRWDPFVHSLEIVQWDSTRRDYPGYPGRVSGSGTVIYIKPKSYKLELLGELVLFNGPSNPRSMIFILNPRIRVDSLTSPNRRDDDLPPKKLFHR